MQAAAYEEPRWEMPVLLPPPPRRVRLTKNGILLRMVAWLLFPGMFVAVYLLKASEVAQVTLLYKQGRVVQGHIYDKSYSTGKNASYHLDYSAPGGVKGSASVSEQEYDSYAVGSPVEITAAPDNPSNNLMGRVDQDRVDRVKGGALGMDVFIGVAVLFLLGVLESAVLKERRFAREAQVLPARIAKVVPVGRNAKSGLLYYDYQRPDGSTAHAMARCTSLTGFMEGSTTAVYYLPNAKAKTRLVNGLFYVTPF